MKRKNSIFDAFDRTNLSAKLESESRFAFLNRSARPVYEKLRTKLDELINEYPTHERHELVQRLRSEVDSQFNSAEFELLLHGLLVRSGYQLVPHPTLTNGSDARPDFLCTGPSGEQFYLEAVLANELMENDGNAPIIGTTLDALAKATHKNFFVMISTDGYPKTQPSGRKLLQATLAWLDTLDPDVVMENIALGGDASEKLLWSHEDLTITLTAWPITKDRRGLSTSLAGGRSGLGGWVDSWSPIRDAVTRKGSKYGKLDKPFVLAVNFLGFTLNPIDERQALFGQEVVEISVGSTDEGRLGRRPNGAWTSPAGPRYTRVSGAWIFSNFHTFSLNSTAPTLYVNPSATLAVPESVLRFKHAAVDSGWLTYNDGARIGDIFELSADWPSD